MATEIERKFLVKAGAWPKITGAAYRQGYLSTDKECTVRVRTVQDQTIGEAHGYLTVKGKMIGVSRAEYEYEIPYVDAEEMLDRLCRRPLIEKIRYKVPQGDVTWEIDEFLGENAGLVVAEVELQTPDQPIQLPAWIAREVTGDTRYANSNLVLHPFRRW